MKHLVNMAGKRKIICASCCQLLEFSVCATMDTCREFHSLVHASVLLITRAVVVAVAAIDNAMELCMQISVLLITRAVAAGQQCHKHNGLKHNDVFVT